MWLTTAMMESLARWLPEAEPWLTPDSLGDGRHAAGAYLENIVARMERSGEHRLARQLEQAA